MGSRGSGVYPSDPPPWVNKLTKAPVARSGRVSHAPRSESAWWLLLTAKAGPPRGPDAIRDASSLRPRASTAWR